MFVKNFKKDKPTFAKALHISFKTETNGNKFNRLLSIGNMP